MRNIFLSVAFIYGLTLSGYAAWWYPRDMHQLQKAVQHGDSKIELRHRINTWGNVGTILLSNLIAIVAFASISSSSIKSKSSQDSCD